jgi:ABC-type multidrug transport system ATPase subunit
VALIHGPRIVFLDEPTGGVDPITRRQFWEMIYEAAAKGITVFVTTHYMDEAVYCNRVSIMVDGVMAACDTPAALKKQFKADTMDEVFYQLARGRSTQRMKTFRAFVQEGIPAHHAGPAHAAGALRHARGADHPLRLRDQYRGEGSASGRARPKS